MGEYGKKIMKINLKKMVNIIHKFSHTSACMSYKYDWNDRNSISEGVDINETNASKESDICHYW